MDHALTRGDPSRRAQGRAPQDEVGDLFHSLEGGDLVFHSAHGQSSSRGILDTRFRGYDDRAWHAAARHFITLRTYGPTTICEKSKMRRRQSAQTPARDSIRAAP